MDFITLALGGGLLYLFFRGVTGGGSESDVSMTVEQAQRALNSLGFKGADGKVLTPDGKLGPNTASALRAFQSKNGLAVSGELDVPTMKALYKASPGSVGNAPARVMPSSSSASSISSSTSSAAGSNKTSTPADVGSTPADVEDPAEYARGCNDVNAQSNTNIKTLSPDPYGSESYNRGFRDCWMKLREEARLVASDEDDASRITLPLVLDILNPYPEHVDVTGAVLGTSLPRRARLPLRRR